MDMNTHILVPHLLTLIFFLVLPRLPAVPGPELDSTMEVLVLGQVGHIPVKGLYTCFTGMGGAAPDLTLQYSSTYTHGSPKMSATCSGDVSQRASLADGSVAYCLPPCPGLEVVDTDRVSIVVSGHDRVTRETKAALMESFILSSVTPMAVQPGQGVVEVQWAARPGRTYRVQLWHHPQALGDAAVEVENNIVVMKTEMGETVGKEECDGEIIESAEPVLKVNDEEVENPEGTVVEGLTEEKNIRYCRKTKQKDSSVTGNEEMVEVLNNEKSFNKDEITGSEKILSAESVDGGLEGDSEVNKDQCGLMSNETLTKVKQCYHELDKDTDDDDNDADNDEDHEDDNDDFLKFMRWRKCVAVYSPCNAATPAPASTPVPVLTSRPLTCTSGPCLYYFTDTPTSGSFSVEVLDVTDAFVLSSHTPSTLVQQWSSLTIDTVAVSSESVEGDSRLKTVTVTLSSTSAESKEGNSEAGKVEGEGDVAEAAEGPQGDLQAVIINGHNLSEVLKNMPAECDLPGGVCSVTGLQTLVHPEEGPVSDMFLLLSNHRASTSILTSITDVQVRVHQVAPGTVVVVWEREPSIREFTVWVIPDNGEPSDIMTVTCSRRGTDCLAIFSHLGSGQYRAEVTYTKRVKVVLSSQFLIDEDNTTSE
ncbi:hypothetical protein GWK47_019168 [Chionoecetes opilio]|uniref:Uncharacterized protein n=1 Tax=Chionoecetes opilio TaxID=41210 RepID=A0A8J5CLE3_CHIOP|nr:hypothetical protein GWK47_019168 [Chionoecetes opilio]